jgi:V/A-type H+-transporting ATPase subunit E
MNGIEKITGRIKSDATEAVRALQQQTEAQCKSIAAEGERKAQAAYWELIRAGNEAAQLRLERLKSAAEMESKKTVLRQKQELISRAFTRAADMLRALPEDTLVPFLAGLAADASASGREELILSPADRAAFGEALCRQANDRLSKAGKTAQLRLSAETRETGGGVILADGRVETNCTFGILVEGVRDSLAQEVAGLLFD